MIKRVMYIKYEGTKRTTVESNVEATEVVLKSETIAPIVQEDVVVDAVDKEQEYMDHLTLVMFEKIRLNKIKLNGGM